MHGRPGELAHTPHYPEWYDPDERESAEARAREHRRIRRKTRQKLQSTPIEELKGGVVLPQPHGTEGELDY